MEKIIFFLLAFLSCLLTYCNSNTVKQDSGRIPIDLNHRTVVFSLNNEYFSGVVGTTVFNSTLKARVYGEGEVEIRGFGDCGYVNPISYQDNRAWFTIPLSELPRKPICLYKIQIRNSNFDNDGIGMIITKDLSAYSDVLPAIVTVNEVKRTGVNWIQLAEDYTLELTKLDGGILESRDIYLYPRGKKGKIIISGCGIQKMIYEFNLEENQTYWKTSLDNLYKDLGGIHQSCLFEITINNDDTYIKEDASIFVSVYKKSGAFIARPIYSEEKGKDCFDFVDSNIIGVKVDDSLSDLNEHKLCVTKAEKHTIEAITSNFRTFIGQWENNVWTIK